MAPLRVGLIGYGIGGAVFHAPLVEATADLELAAVATSNADRRTEIASRYPRTDVVTSADDLFARDDLDLVVVASPNSSHVSLALRAIDKGLAVVVDKPVAVAVDEAAALQAAVANGAVVSVFQNRRWDADFLTLKQLVADGQLGEVRRFESRFERWRPVPKEGWRTNSGADEGGGVLFDLGAHLVDQALQLFGPVDSVYAETQHRTTTSDDDAFVALQHRNGVLSHLWMSSITPLLGPRFRVLGSTAGFVKQGLDPQESALKEGSTPGGAGWGEESSDAWGELGNDERVDAIPSSAGNYLAFYEQMATAVRGTTPVPVLVDEAVASLAVIEAAHQSARTHESISLR